MHCIMLIESTKPGKASSDVRSKDYGYPCGWSSRRECEEGFLDAGCTVYGRLYLYNTYNFS